MMSKLLKPYNIKFFIKLDSRYRIGLMPFVVITVTILRTALEGNPE
jgi:hypothetical protein